MKKYKASFVDALLDELVEIVIGLIAFGIGAVIVTLFGMDWDSPIDSELIVLIGVAVPIVIAIVAMALAKHFKKKSRQEETCPEEENS